MLYCIWAGTGQMPRNSGLKTNLKKITLVDAIRTKHLDEDEIGCV